MGHKKKLAEDPKVYAKFRRERTYLATEIPYLMKEMLQQINEWQDEKKRPGDKEWHTRFFQYEV